MRRFFRLRRNQLTCDSSIRIWFLYFFIQIPISVLRQQIAIGKDPTRPNARILCTKLPADKPVIRGEVSPTVSAIRTLTFRTYRSKHHSLQILTVFSIIFKQTPNNFYSMTDCYKSRATASTQGRVSRINATTVHDKYNKKCVCEICTCGMPSNQLRLS